MKSDDCLSAKHFDHMLAMNDMDESAHSSSYFALILSRVKSYLSYQ